MAFYKTVTKNFLSYLGERADRHLETVSSADIRKCRDSVVAKGCTGKTANHKLKCLRSIFGDAVKASALLQNPASSAKQLNEDDSTSREPFAKAEIAKLVKAAPSSDWRGVILLGAFADLRLTDCAKLKAGNVDMEARLLRFMPRKSDRKKKVIELPLHQDLIAFFEENEPSPFDATPLFPSLEKVTTGGRRGLSARLKEIMETAKVERNVTRRMEEGAARETSARSFHSLRHSFTSMLANAQVSEEIRQKMTGHTESTTHKIYTHFEMETLRSGVEKSRAFRPNDYQ